jgi:hypothetical protein
MYQCRLILEKQARYFRSGVSANGGSAADSTPWAPPLSMPILAYIGRTISLI